MMLFIVNPISGNGRKLQIVTYLKKMGYKVVCTEYAGHGEILAREASEEIVVAVGGDGTVHDVLNGIAAYVDSSAGYGLDVSFSDFSLGVIPVGSGNDWIKSIGMKKGLKEAVRAIVSGRIRKQDLVMASLLDDADREISRSYMINGGGIGLDARVCERVNEYKRRGKKGRFLYLTSLLYVLYHRKPKKAKVVCDGEMVFDGPYLSMAFGLGRYSGGGMRQTPEAVLDDGLLDVTVIPELPLGRIACEIYRLFTGSFLKIPEIVSAKSHTVTVCPYDSYELEPVEVDGELAGRGKVRFQVLDSQINIVY